MTNRIPTHPAATRRLLSALAATAVASAAIFTIGAGNARAATACADRSAIADFKTDDASAAPITAAFKTKDGKSVPLATAAKGTGAVVNLWATWCLPCVKEMPSLDRLNAVLAKDGIPVLAVSQDRGGLDRVEPFFAKHGFKNLAISLDPDGNMAGAFHLRGLPTTVLIDAKGRELGRVEGGVAWDKPAVVSFIRDCLKSASAKP